jgi:hypothetical protein
MLHFVQTTFKTLLFPAFLLFIACNTNSIGEDKELVDNNSNQNGWYTVKPVLRYDDAIYIPTIHTPLCFKTGNELAPPVISLSSDETVTIVFDDFDNSIKDLYYSIIHCDANWQPSGLMEQEYLDGFFTYNITQYKFSFNTLQAYLNYTLTIPNEYTKIKRSGNYLVKIYAANDPEKLVLTRRFMVYENIAMIQPQYQRSSDTEDRMSHQELDLKITTTGVSVTNPFSDIKIVIMQNGRWDNAVRNIQPKFIRDQELIYDLDKPNNFAGGNEFRFFDLKTLAYNTPNVARIIRDSVPFRILLGNDEYRGIKKYITNYDINGKFLVKNDIATDHHTEADYVWVHFYLPYDEPTTEGNLYVFGALSDWKIKDECRLKYNYTSKKYEVAILLKQGYYNYQYVLSRDNSPLPDETYIEGSHFDTENDYTILVYFFDISKNCDRLIGVHKFNTSKG